VGSIVLQCWGEMEVDYVYAAHRAKT